MAIHYQRRDAHLVFVRDITERKRAEEALHRSEERFRGVFDNAAAMVAVSDRTGQWTHANQHAIETLGYSLAELCRMQFNEFTHPADREQNRLLFDRIVRGEADHGRIVKRYVRKDGGIVWVDLSASPIHNEKGEVEAVVGVGLDVTAAKEAQEEIRRSRLFLQTVLDAFPGNVAVLDGQGRIATVNEWWRQFGAAEGLREQYQTLGTNYLEVCRQSQGQDREMAVRAADGIEAVLAGRQGEFDMEYPCSSPTQERWFRLRASGFTYEGKRWAVVAHLDITERKRAEERSARANQNSARYSSVPGMP